jgi:hypothetical protein
MMISRCFMLIVDVLKSGASDAINRPSGPWHKLHFIV